MLGFRKLVSVPYQKFLVRRIYTTFILGAALLNFGTRTCNIGHGRLHFCRVKANFSARVPKHWGGPRQPQEVVSARLKRDPRAANQKYSRPQSPCAHDWSRNRRLWGRKWAFSAPNILYVFAGRWRRRIAKFASGITTLQNYWSTYCRRRLSNNSTTCTFQKDCEASDANDKFESYIFLVLFFHWNIRI